MEVEWASLELSWAFLRFFRDLHSYTHTVIKPGESEILRAFTGEIHRTLGEFRYANIISRSYASHTIH